MTRLLLRDIPKAMLGFDGFELAIEGGFRGLRNVPAGFHRIELVIDRRMIALHIVVAADAVYAFVLRGDHFEPAPPSPLDGAAVAGDLDHALIDVAALPELPVQAWRALTSRLASADDAAAWRTTEVPADAAAWRALDDAGAVSQIRALQGAWLAMTHDREEAAADHLALLFGACGDVDRAIVARHPAVFAELLDGVAAIRMVAGEFAEVVIDGLRPLLEACTVSGAPLAAAAAAQFA